MPATGLGSGPVPLRRRAALASAVLILLAGCSSEVFSAPPSESKRLSPRAALIPKPGDGARVPNTVFLRVAAPANRPYSISRFFAMGDIPHFAQAVVNGERVTTQCDVKTRWPDGSVQHAIVSFWADLPAGTSAVDFTDQAAGSNDGALGAEQMLSPEYGFGAVTELASGGLVVRADARQMLERGAFRYWLHGPVCTQVIIEDRTPARAFDIGFDEEKPFHPMFIATFYPGWNGVKVDWIGEVDWTDKLTDMTYSLALKAGQPLAGAPVYSKPDYAHLGMTRWRKSAWIGKPLPQASVDFNLPYLIHSRVVPSFDLTKVVSSKAIQSEYDAFSRGDRGELGGSAQWLRYFPTTGGRADIGLFPRWYVRYLYTFDPRLEEVMMGDAAASAYMPIHFREGLDRKYLKDSDETAAGRPVSVEARPSIWISRLDWTTTTAEDRVRILQPLAKSPWSVDLPHQPSIVFLPYIFTGDYFLLEELQFWAAYNVASADPQTCRYCRHADWGYIHNELRGQAWGLRTLAHAALVSPDGSPEKKYFTDKVNVNIAVREGIADIHDGAFYDPSPSSPWSFGRKSVCLDMPNPLRFMHCFLFPADPKMFVTEPDSPDAVKGMYAPWEFNFMHVVLGHISELGFPASTLQRTMALNLLHQLADPVYNPYLAGEYRMPVSGADGKFFTSWQAAARGWRPSYWSQHKWPGDSDYDVEHGYAHIARAAASFLDGICEGDVCGTAAWAWLNGSIRGLQLLNDNPKWALTPRSSQAPPALLAAVQKKAARAVKPAAVRAGQSRR